MLVQSFGEGAYTALNYWGGWTMGIGEGILESTGTSENPSYELTAYGLILAAYFNEVSSEEPVGVKGLRFGYYLNNIQLKRPYKFTREFVYQKTDYTAITGKTTRDIGSLKEKYVLGFKNLTKAQVDALIEIVELNQAVTFTANGKDILSISKLCFPYIGAIEYSTPGAEYRASLQLELIEEE